MPQRRRYRRPAVTALIILAVVFIYMSGWLRPVIDPLARVLLAAAAPLHGAGAAVSRAWDGLAAGNGRAADELRAENGSLQVENAKLRALIAENDQLKASLDYHQKNGGDDAVTARVVYESGDEGSRSLVLDKGSDDGLAAGQPVITGAGVIVGKISAAGRLTSTVTPLMDSSSRLAVTVENAQDTLGVLAGDRDLSMAVTLIPQTEQLSPGETVITSGLEAGIRRGLAVGTVEKVDRSTEQPFQSANIIPFTSAQHPLFVQVLRTAAAPGE